MKFLFYVSKKYSIPIVQPIIEYLKNTDEEFALFVSAKVKKNLPDELLSSWVLNNIYGAKKFKPDFVIVPGNFVDYRIPGLKVQIFHGLGVEKASHFKIRHFFDVYCTSGPYITKKFKQLKQKYRYFLVKETGWPKIDHILNFPTNNLHKKYNIPNNKKIVLFAPTHSNKMQSAEKLLPMIPDIVKQDEFWIIKFHELMKKEITEEFNSESVEVVDCYDITPYLHLADVLISDTSSVIYEFMLLDKPIITYKTVSRIDKGINIKNKDQLRPALNRSYAHPQEFAQKRSKHISEINPYTDGKISCRLIQTLKKIKLQDLLPEKKKPLNLFRKLQILYHEKFKKGYLR